MLCTIPDYYKEFSCIAGDCEDTCCAGWQIVIDEKSKRRYAIISAGFIRWRDRTACAGLVKCIRAT